MTEIHTFKSFEDNDTVYFTMAKDPCDIINSNGIWYTYGFVGYKYNSGEHGNANGIDKLYGFRFKIGSATHYGWLKANLATNYKTFTIKEVAYHKTANTPIKAGEK